MTIDFCREGRRLLLLASALCLACATSPGNGSAADSPQWIGSWASSPQRPVPGAAEQYENQTLRLIVRSSAGGAQLRVRLSNAFGSEPLLIGAAHAARRSTGANIEPGSDRVVTFGGRPSVTVPAGGMVVSDPVDLALPALSELAVSLFLPKATVVSTGHLLAVQTSYVSSAKGNVTAAEQLPLVQPLEAWPLLCGIDVRGAPGAAGIVALGDSLTDGDGSTADANRRWPDVLAERLQRRAAPGAERSVLNAGLIGNRLLHDGPSPESHPLGPVLGQAGLVRFERDVLAQAGARYVILQLGINDIGLPGSVAPASESVSAEALIAGYRQFVARAHRAGIRVIGTTLGPFENAKAPRPGYYTPEKEAVRTQVNAWIRTGGTFDGVVDVDAVLRDPTHPTRLLPTYDSGDHLHPNDVGYTAIGNAIPLTLFEAVGPVTM